jgi:D-3-phosphoglycerate dehydrogenase
MTVAGAPPTSDAAVAVLVRDLLAWVGDERPYDEVMEVWRTSCPRLPVWEEAVAHGYVAVAVVPGLGRVVTRTDLGRALLADGRREDARRGE